MDIVHFEMIEVLANIKRVVKRNIHNRELFLIVRRILKFRFARKKEKSDFPTFHPGPEII